MIVGSCDPKDKEIADMVKSELAEVLSDVKHKLDIKICYDVGAAFPEIQNANNVMTEG